MGEFKMMVYNRENKPILESSNQEIISTDLTLGIRIKSIMN